MIPLRDANPSQTTPFVNYALIAANAFVFILEFLLGDRANDLIFSFGIIPINITNAVHSFSLNLFDYLPLFTSMFLHGGWMHVIGNMLFLHIFGDNIEDRLGHGRYLIFYLIAGIAAALTQVMINPISEVPMIGASGAIAGVMGGYVLLYPTARIVTLIPLFVFFQVIELPAFIFLGLWFLLQIISGAMALGIGADAGGVAWWAHIGGFAAGAVMLPAMKKRRGCA